jgi:hypothetical protein
MSLGLRGGLVPDWKLGHPGRRGGQDRVVCLTFRSSHVDTDHPRRHRPRQQVDKILSCSHFFICMTQNFTRSLKFAVPVPGTSVQYQPLCGILVYFIVLIGLKVWNFRPAVLYSPVLVLRGVPGTLPVLTSDYNAILVSRTSTRSTTR